jgi:hypothetical protein
MSAQIRRNNDAFCHFTHLVARRALRCFAVVFGVAAFVSSGLTTFHGSGSSDLNVTSRRQWARHIVLDSGTPLGVTSNEGPRKEAAMPRTNKAGALVVMESELLTSRHAQLDDFTVAFENYHVDADGAPVFKACPTTAANARV